jgi:hypothetical protein
MSLDHHVTLPDGTAVCRESSRRFTHAVAIRPTFDAEHLAAHPADQTDHDRWFVAGFCGSLARAESLARDAAQRYARLCAGRARVETKILRVRATP